MSRRKEGERAGRAADYIDSLVVARRQSGDNTLPASREDAEFRDLMQLAEELAHIEPVMTPEAEARLRRQIRETTDKTMASRGRGGRIFGFFRLEGHSANQPRRSAWLQLSPARGLLMAAVSIFIVLFDYVGAPEASATEILVRAETALGRLAQPGQWLQRRWKIVEHVQESVGSPVAVTERYLDWWLDGSASHLVAGHSRRHKDGQPYLAMSTNGAAEGSPAQIYYAPGFAGEPDGLLSSIPSSDDIVRALERFPAAQQALLRTYLARRALYEPGSSERELNLISLRTLVGSGGSFSRIHLSVETAVLDATPVYKVRIVDPARVQVRWRSVGPPSIWLQRQETVRYITRETYMMVRAEEVQIDPDGRRIALIRSLEDSELVNSDAASTNPFVLQVERGVRVRRQSADEYLEELLSVLLRAPLSH